MPRWLRARVLERAVAFLFAVLLIPALSAIAAEPGSAPVGFTVRLHPEGQPPLDVYAEEMGAGPPVLLLHGLGGSSYTWRHIAPRLAERHRVVALDMRGFGRSDKPFDESYGPADHVAVVKAFIVARNLSGLTLIGHSYGGLIALLTAMDRRLAPHRITRLVTMSAPAFPQPISSGVRFLRQPVLPYIALFLVPPELTTTLALMMEKVGFDQITSRDISIYAGPLSDPGGPHALIETARQIVPPDLDRIIARYPAMTKPTLVLWCRDDQVVPVASGQRLAQTLPRARLAVMDGCDHMPAEQAPAAVVWEIRRFLAREAARTAAQAAARKSARQAAQSLLPVLQPALAAAAE